jgi:septal ring factor EnvC (AmiA/AmiB activator)
MRQTLLALLVGLALGAGGVWAYEHFLGDHPVLTQVRTDLQISRQALEQQEKKSTQLQQAVTALKQDHEKLLAQIQATETPTPAPTEPPAPSAEQSRMTSIMDATMTRMKGDKLLSLKSRLKLRPDQEQRLKIALDEESRQHREMAEKMMKGEKLDPAALAKANPDRKTVESELQAMLDPEQKKEYEAMKADEKKGRLETSATFEMNKVAPVLGLNDKQKDDFYNAIYHMQEDLQSPEGLKKYETAGAPPSTDPLHYLDLQRKAKKEAVKDLLTPAQLETYTRQLDSEYELQKSMVQKFMPPTKTP